MIIKNKSTFNDNLFKDNDEGAIEAVDLRYFVDSVYGSAYSSLISASYPLSGDNVVVLVNAISGDVILQLPAISSAVSGVSGDTGFLHKFYFIKKIDSSLNNVILSATNPDTIESGTSYSFNSNGDCFIFEATSQGWKIIGSYQVGGGFKIEYHTVTSAEITGSKSFSLINTPTDTNQVAIDIVNQTSLENVVDFSISGNIVSWSGLEIDGILQAGDKLRILYPM